MSARVLAKTRLDAVRAATTRQPRRFEQQVDGQQVSVVSHYYGVNTFSFSAMQERLPRPIYKRLMAIIRAFVVPAFSSRSDVAARRLQLRHGRQPVQRLRPRQRLLRQP